MKTQNFLKNNWFKIGSLFVLILSIILIIIVLKSIKTNNKISEVDLKEKDSYIDITDKYLKDKNCEPFNPDNITWINCTEDILRKIQIDKADHFQKVKKLVKLYPNNILTNDPSYEKNINDWYNNSTNYNHLKCLMAVSWTAAGSAYSANLSFCEISETLRDIDMLDELYIGLMEWIDVMDK